LKKLAATGTRIIVTGHNVTGLTGVTNFADCPCKKYEEMLDANLEKADVAQAAELLASLKHQQDVEIVAPPTVATSIALIDGKPYIFLANFSGLRSGANAVPTPQNGITLRLHSNLRVRYLPFLSDVQEIPAVKDGDSAVYHLPAVGRGGVAWLEDPR
jgi:hypothetical protein